MLKASADPEFLDWGKKRRERRVRARWQAAGLICASLLVIFAVPALLSRYKDDTGGMVRWAQLATWISDLAGMVGYFFGLYGVWRTLINRAKVD